MKMRLCIFTLNQTFNNYLRTKNCFISDFIFEIVEFLFFMKKLCQSLITEESETFFLHKPYYFQTFVIRIL